IANGGEQQSVGALRRRRAYDAQSRVMAEQRFKALAMMFGCVDTATVRNAQYNRATQTTARTIAQACHMVGYLVQSRIDETHKLDFYYGFEALRGHADRSTGNQPFSQRRILHTFATKALLQAHGGAKYPTIHAHVLAQYHHCRV